MNKIAVDILTARKEALLRDLRELDLEMNDARQHLNDLRRIQRTKTLAAEAEIAGINSAVEQLAPVEKINITEWVNSLHKEHAVNG